MCRYCLVYTNHQDQEVGFEVHSKMECVNKALKALEVQLLKFQTVVNSSYSREQASKLNEIKSFTKELKRTRASLNKRMFQDFLL